MSVCGYRCLQRPDTSVKGSCEPSTISWLLRNKHGWVFCKSSTTAEPSLHPEREKSFSALPSVADGITDLFPLPPIKDLSLPLPREEITTEDLYPSHIDLDCELPSTNETTLTEETTCYESENY